MSSSFASRYDDAARLSLGNYASNLSASASRVEYLLRRLAQSFKVTDPRVADMVNTAFELADELERSDAHEGVPDRDIPIDQLLPTRMRREVLASDPRLLNLGPRLRESLTDGSETSVSAAQYTELADLIDMLNSKLQQQASEAIVS